MDEPLFVRDGVPVQFVFHNSIQRPGTIQALSYKIWDHGGEILDDDDGADILLINPTRPGTNQRILQGAYDCHPDKDKSRIWVREMSFVDECIRLGVLRLESPLPRPMPGFPPGKRRNQFSSEDIENLCKHLARALPYPASGGRQSLTFYKRMVSYPKCMYQAYDWTQRHTPQSWREYYKKNKARLDLRIAEIVAEEGIDPKSLYDKDRLRNPQEDEEMEEEPREEANRVADEEEEAYEREQQDTAGHNLRKEQEHVTENENLLDPEDNQDANRLADEEGEMEREQQHTARRTLTKGKGRKDEPGLQGSYGTAETQAVEKSHKPRTRPQQDTRLSPRHGTTGPEPSQTLVNIDPPSQPTDHNEDSASETAFPAVIEGSQDPEHLQPFTLSFKELMPSSSTGPNDRVSAELPTLEEPPFRNTRSRARSRSASADPAPVPPRPKRKARTPRIPDSRTLPSLREISHEPESLFSDHEHDNERDPLFSDSDVQVETQLNPTEVATNVTATRKRRRRDDESEDDKQTRDMLENARGNDVLVEMVPTVQGRGQPRRQDSLMVPETPAPRRRQPRKQVSPAGSASSSSVVPADGTRASEHKKKRTQEETYNTPFKPIRGSQAARRLEQTAA